MCTVLLGSTQLSGCHRSIAQCSRRALIGRRVTTRGDAEVGINLFGGHSCHVRGLVQNRHLAVAQPPHEREGHQHGESTNRGNYGNHCSARTVARLLVLKGVRRRLHWSQRWWRRRARRRGRRERRREHRRPNLCTDRSHFRRMHRHVAREHGRARCAAPRGAGKHLNLHVSDELVRFRDEVIELGMNRKRSKAQTGTHIFSCSSGTTRFHVSGGVLRCTV